MNYNAKRLIMGVCSAAILLGTTIGIHHYNKPYRIYKRAIANTESQVKTQIKNKLLSTGELEELTSQSIDYSIDRNKKIIEITKNEFGKDDKTEILINDDKLYIKDGEDYISILDSDYIKDLSNSLSVEGTDAYDTYQEAIKNCIDKDDITLESGTKIVDNKEMKLKLLNVTIDKDEAKSIIYNYISNEYLENLHNLVDETIETEVELAKNNNIEYSDEDINTLKEKLLSSLTIKIEEKLNSMEYSDINIVIGVDSSGLIRYREESYQIILEDKVNSIRNITEYIAFGNSVSITDPGSINIKTYDEVLNNYASSMKDAAKEKSLENLN